MRLSGIAQAIAAKSVNYRDVMVPQSDVRWELNNGLAVTAEGETWTLNAHSLTQAANLVDVSESTIANLIRHDAGDELVSLLNKATANTDKRHRKLLFRTDGSSLRAVLTDRYSVVDNKEVVNRLMELVGDVDTFRYTYKHDILSIYLKANDNRHTLPDGTVVTPTALVTNSEIGNRNLSLFAGIFRFICTNGLVIPVGAGSSIMRKTPHLGKANERFYSLLESGTKAMADFDGTYLDEQFKKPIAHADKFFANVAEQYKISAKVIGDIVRTYRLYQCHPSLFGAVDAMTRFGQRTDDPESWDVMAGQMSTLSKSTVDQYSTTVPKSARKKYEAVLSL